MPTKIYDTNEIELIDGTRLEIIPLKIKYLRQFMQRFDEVKYANGDMEAISILADCVRIAMKQFCPSISTVEMVEDRIDLPTIYKIIEHCAGIKIGNPESVQESITTNNSNNENTWENMDLVKYEAEVFSLGTWKNFDDLESNISMSELMVIIESMRELDYNEKKFLAAMQGVDLDETSGRNKQDIDPWEAMKARVASNGATSDPNDIISYQGQRAAKAGFGIGMGLDYEVITN
jgi:hypothetical protein